ncbi:MAG: FAD-dependent oxidoreductase [Symploca sp. SIO2B6]|nr:FAD-dependent oxidoreductase [Symploca sp. SIO2B6]
MNDKKIQKFDIVILGSGLAGSILATILARHNLRVLIIDKNAHPRFAIGEAVTPDTDLMLKILSHQYSVPEIAHLSSFDNICENISPSACGFKRSFNFVYHRETEDKTWQEYDKLGVHPSSHLFRQDVDQYMIKVATSYGVKLLEKTNVVDLKIDTNCVALKIDSNEQFVADYLIDASGYNSPVSRQFNLRETTTRFKTNSRSLFTHMVGVKKYDDCIQASRNSQDTLSWHEGTLHHLFDGGWMWVIPFNNHAKSTNQICSVGVNFDNRRFPKDNISPEQEFKNLLLRFPNIATQFEHAQSVRNWVSTGRLQYSSHSCAGERFYVVPHASGFVDALFSFGLVNTYTIIIPLAARILKACSERDFSTKYFSDLERLQQQLFDYNDKLINCSYISFADYNLWNAWKRVWILGSTLRQWKAGIRKGLKIEAGRGEELSQTRDEDNIEYLTPSFEGLGDDFFQEATTTVEKVAEGLISPDEAAKKIISLIKSIDFLPKNYLGLGNESYQYFDLESRLGKSEQSRFLSWVKTSSKPEVKKYFDYKMEDLVAAIKR